jgi:hypothetical protein
MFPLSINSNSIASDPLRIGLGSKLGLNPENNKIGARMRRTSKKLKQTPYKALSVRLYSSYS